MNSRSLKLAGVSLAVVSVMAVAVLFGWTRWVDQTLSDRSSAGTVAPGISNGNGLNAAGDPVDYSAKASDESSPFPGERSTTTKLPSPSNTAVVASLKAQSAAYDMARGNWPDDEFYSAVKQLRSNPELLQALLAEFQGETDSLRLRRLSQLLAEVDSPLLAEAAIGMVYSGNAASKSAGMDLLRRIQPTNPLARDVALDLLTTETDPKQLKSVLDIFARPGVATLEQQRAIINQVAPLASHESALLRRQSLSILSRWVDDDSQTPVFRAGLSDDDENVRLAAAFAVVDYPYANDALKQDLLSIVETESNNDVRGAALLALSGMSLNEEQQRRVRAFRDR